MNIETNLALKQAAKYLRWLSGTDESAARVRDQDKLTSDGCRSASMSVQSLADTYVPVDPIPEPVVLPNGFKVFNALLNLEHKPVVKGPSRMTVLYEGTFNLAKTGMVSDAGFANAVANVAAQRAISKWSNHNGHIAIDIESRALWPWRIGAQHVESVEFYANIAKRMKARFPNEKLGMYNVFPIGGISIAQQIQKNPTKRQQFEDANRIAALAIAPHVDYLSPSFYSFYSPKGNQSMVQYRIDEWKQGVNEHMALAREFMPNTPVYPYIWPQYHGLFTMVEPVIWRAQLEHIKQVCDGIILWGMLKPDGTGNEQKWDASAEWWAIAKDVLRIEEITNG